MAEDLIGQLNDLAVAERLGRALAAAALADALERGAGRPDASLRRKRRERLAQALRAMAGGPVPIEAGRAMQARPVAAGD
jgi:hypothetical protein